MGKPYSYQTPPAIGAGYTWKDAAAVLTIIVVMFFGRMAYHQWQDPTYDLERSHLYRIAYSHPVIREITGGTSNASFAHVPKEGRLRFARSVPEDWTRQKEAGVIRGRARMLIFGKVGGGIFTLTYRYEPASDLFHVLQIEKLGQPLIKEGPSSRHSATRLLRTFLFARVAHRVADLNRSAKHETPPLRFDYHCPGIYRMQFFHP